MNEDLPHVHPLQALVNEMGRRENEKRAKTQMTLGKLIDALKVLESTRPIVGFGEEDSYRGYYCDLAFKPSEETTTAGELLERCQAAMGRTYQGYKGGDNVMHENTPLWISEYGTASGLKVMDLDTGTDPIGVLTEEEQW